MKSHIDFEEKYTVESIIPHEIDIYSELDDTSEIEIPTDLKVTTDFAKNEEFFKLIKHPDLFQKLKLEIIAYLRNQQFDQFITKDSMRHSLWGINEVSAYKNSNNVFARCSDKHDTIIKMYHLAKMTGEKRIAKLIQDKITSGIQSHLIPSSDYDEWMYLQATKIALACDCHTTVKPLLYNALNFQIDHLSSKKTSMRDYNELLNLANDCELLDASVANKVKNLIPSMDDTYPNDCYDSIVTLLNKVSPNLISDVEYKNYVISVLERSEKQTWHSFDYMYGRIFINGVMKRPDLYNDQEIFSKLLSLMQPLNFGPYTQIYVDEFHKTFETRQFEPWQTDLINASKKSSEEYLVASNTTQPYPLYDEKPSKFLGLQTIFIIMKIPKFETASSNYEIHRELLLQPTILFDSITNVINASLNGKHAHATQVGMSKEEASAILSQHSYYKYYDGVIAVKAVVDGCSLSYFSEAKHSFALNAGTKDYPVLKTNTVIQPSQVLSIHKLDILDRKLNEKVANEIVNTEAAGYKAPEPPPLVSIKVPEPKTSRSPKSPTSFFTRLFNKLGISKNSDEEAVNNKPDKNS